MSILTTYFFYTLNFNSDSKFTYYKGIYKSQCDICLSNSTKNIVNFKILEKTSFSDHCPCVLHIQVPIITSLAFINDCSSSFCNYNHLDINKKRLPPINIKNLDLSVLYENLDNLASNIYSNLNLESVSNNELSNAITVGIYEA